MTTPAEIAARLALRKAANGWVGACPACGYPTGLRLNSKAGKAMWWCASCQDQPALTAAIAQAMGGDMPAPSATPAAPKATEASRTDKALALWSRVLPWVGTAVAHYLAHRHPGVNLPAIPDIGYLPDAKHPAGSRLPCMVALLRDGAGNPKAVHRTFLAPGGIGKAAVEPQRMTLGEVRGGAVRIYPAAPKLVVAEGIETALSAAVLLRLPAWSAISAGNMAETLALPPEVREVVIAADHDAPGLRAAAKAAARWKAEGRRVQIAKPDREGADFNDVLLERWRRG